ncbi:cdc42 effector protein 3-like [Osmerus mordax]|uniref:cdc42 effector protein 3-like n=1 Tax=Osmerus mordax TaxID=8014 RepID=UPI0035107E43
MPLRASLQRKSGSGYWSGRSHRRKAVLSVNMISLPLADFRHVTHIGNDAHADSFGDLSFLKRGHSLLLQSSQSEQNIFLACSPPPKPPRLNLDEPPHTDSPGWPSSPHSSSQRKTKCNSMPLLDSEVEEQGTCGASTRRRVGDSYSPGGGSLSSERDGDSTLTCPEDSTLTCPEDSTLQEDDCGFSFSLDLGPSILDDVLQVMEKHQH